MQSTILDVRCLQSRDATLFKIVLISLIAEHCFFVQVLMLLYVQTVRTIRDVEPRTLRQLLSAEKFR